jgi:hypothetical protein
VSRKYSRIPGIAAPPLGTERAGRPCWILKTRSTAASRIEQSPAMEMRHMKITEGARVWVQTLAGQLAAPGWENGHEATAIRINCGGSSR